jgi:hypothetical protein
MPNQLIHFLAPARISGYRSFLKLSTHDEVYRAYCWNYAVSASVFPLLGCVEMHLRDAVHREMSTRHAPAGAANPHSYPWYDWNQGSHYPLLNKARDDVYALLYVKKTGLLAHPAPSTDDVVASLTFGFWTNLFRSFTPVQAPQLIPRILPNHHIVTPAQWGSKSVRAALNDHLRIANDFRNRVAHHEPLFKFRYKQKYPKSLNEGLKNLRACLEDCLTVSGWVDTTARDALKRSLWYRQFRELSTKDCFNSWVRVGLPEAAAGLTWRCAEYASKVGLVPG